LDKEVAWNENEESVLLNSSSNPAINGYVGINAQLAVAKNDQ
jgi:hypothetical protein